MKQKIIGCLLLFVLLTGCGAVEESSASVPELLEPVGIKLATVPAEISDLVNVVAYKGAVVPYVEELQFTVDGTLEDVHVLLGDFVEEGQILATLSEERINEQIQQLEKDASIIATQGGFYDRQQQARIELAKIELEQMQKSRASEQELRLQELEIRQLELDLKQAQELRQLELGAIYAALQEQRNKLGNSQLTAPFSGRVVYVGSYRAGDAVVGYTTVFCLADESRISVSAEYISDMYIQGAERIYARILDRDYELTYVPYDMEEYITQSLSGATLDTEFEVDAEPGELECGQYAAVLVVDQTKEDALCVPVNALYTNAGGDYVYLVEDGQRIVRDVTIGMRTDARVEILEGLEEGDLVYVRE